MPSIDSLNFDAFHPCPVDLITASSADIAMLAASTAVLSPGNVPAHYVICRQEGCVDVSSSLLGFSAYKYVAGVGLLPHLNDAFKPVSTAFSVAPSTDTGDGFCYSHPVEQCKAVCPGFDTLEVHENYVGVSTPATVQAQRSRDKLNLATT
jgi:hypothetical protein